ncbi:MAG TPA: hypothetical protein VK849_08455 [Longimicrobiales bacterium]|nr:hypothetical protein [Longimicrobiales bacterium]
MSAARARSVALRGPAAGWPSRAPRPGRRGLPGACALTLAAAVAWSASPPPAAAQQTHALVVAGLGGTAEYRDRFAGWARDLHGALTGRFGIPEDNVVVLLERPEAAPGIGRDRSTKDNVTAALTEIAGRAGPEDRVLVVLIGHGTAQGDDARFNLPGPDLSAADLAVALAGFPSQRVALVHTGSASGGFVAPLSGPNRVIVAATRTARERDAPRFAGYFVQAFTDDVSDLDKDGQVSVLEAFRYARAEVARDYEEANELLTEHAVLDDDGDGEGSQDAGPDTGDGRLAAAFRLGTVTTTPAPETDDPVLARLYGERRAIQERIDLLRASREAVPPERYERDLEDLLVELALKNREIRERGGDA